jgi:hypothetical protein
MTEEQINEALEQMKSHCRISMEAHKAGVGEYEMVSARGVLYTLGYAADNAEEVIQAIADRGFSYCLDPHILSTPGDDPPFYPSADACHWGADQLLSRLDALRSS